MIDAINASNAQQMRSVGVEHRADTLTSTQ